MRKINVENAIGMELCHDITEMKDGFKGAAFKRGHIIRTEDIPHLLDIGKRTVFVWEENAGEIHEDDCARRMAAMAPVEGAHYTEPSEGKVLLFADQRGMLRVNTRLLNRINAIGDITIATLPDHYPVEPGARLASMRIVPLVTQESQIIEAERLCAFQKLLELLPYQDKKVGVIITGSEVYHGRIKDKFEPVIRGKMKQYPSQIIGVTICDDDLDMITAAARAHLEKGADFLIFTGGMSVDPDDNTPGGIKQSGARIVSYGAPVLPGAMFLLGYFDDGTPICGLPGCVMYAGATIFDLLLPRLAAGVEITKEDITAYGEGGLCLGCSVCRYPECSFGK